MFNKYTNDTVIDLYPGRKWEYNGYKFVLEANVDSVQDHNAQDAILSAWGIDVSVNNGKLALK